MNLKIALIVCVVLASISVSHGAPQFEFLTNVGQTIFGGIRDIVALPGQFFSSVFGGSDDDDNVRPNRQTSFDQNGNQFDQQGNFIPGTPLGRR